MYENKFQRYCKATSNVVDSRGNSYLSTFSQIEGVWEATYGDKYNNGIPSDEVDTVRKKFIKDLEKAKLEGAAHDLPKFTHYMVSAILC